MVTCFESLIDKTTYIVGSDKNAGKTTFLNYALNKLRPNTSVLFLSVGVDGETKDLVFGTPKPQVMTNVGDFVITTDSAISKSSALFEIIQVFPYKTVLGKIVLARTVRSGHIELIGPENNDQLKNVIAFAKNECNVKTILVDGAVNRITQVSTSEQAGFIYVFKVSHNNIHSSLRKLKMLSIVMDFTIATTSVLCNSETVIIDGALTKSKLSQIPIDCKNVVMKDFTKVFVSDKELVKLLDKYDLFFENCYHLNFVVVNLYDIAGDEFEKMLKSKDIDLKIIYNPYQIRTESC